jgi:hypothetical protein
MAVENKYVDSNLVAGKKADGLAAIEGGLFIGVATFETAAADDNDSVYRVFKNVDPNLIPVSMRLSCDAIAGFTDANVGVYETELGAVIDDNCFADALNPSAGYSRILGLDMLAAVDLADAKKRVYELAGHTLTTKKAGYDIAITAIAAASAAGTVTVVAIFAQG